MPDMNQVLMEQLGGVLQTEYCVLRHSNGCFSYFPHRWTLVVYEYVRSTAWQFVYRPERSWDSKMSFKNHLSASKYPQPASQSCCLGWLSRCSLCRKQLYFTSLKGGAGSVFSFGQKHWLWMSQEGRTRHPPVFPIALDRPPQLFLQHLVVAEPLLLVFESILATSSLSESPDDRISSRPLRWKHRQRAVNTQRQAEEIRLCVLCVL